MTSFFSSAIERDVASFWSRAPLLHRKWGGAEGRGGVGCKFNRRSKSVASHIGLHGDPMRRCFDNIFARPPSGNRLTLGVAVVFLPPPTDVCTPPTLKLPLLLRKTPDLPPIMISFLVLDFSPPSPLKSSITKSSLCCYCNENKTQSHVIVRSSDSIYLVRRSCMK